MIFRAVFLRWSRGMDGDATNVDHLLQTGGNRYGFVQRNEKKVKSGKILKQAKTVI